MLPVGTNSQLTLGYRNTLRINSDLNGFTMDTISSENELLMVDFVRFSSNILCTCPLKALHSEGFMHRGGLCKGFRLKPRNYIKWDVSNRWSCSITVIDRYKESCVVFDFQLVLECWMTWSIAVHIIFMGPPLWMLLNMLHQAIKRYAAVWIIMQF